MTYSSHEHCVVANQFQFNNGELSLTLAKMFQLDKIGHNSA